MIFPIPLLLSIGFSLGEQIYGEFTAAESGRHVRYSCENGLDLRDPGQSFEGMPFLDQGDTTLCAPYTASAMIDAWRTRQRGSALPPSERTSPMALAVEYAARSDFPYSFPLQNSTDPLGRARGRWGGIACVYVASAREIGACTDDSLRETQGQSLEAIAKTDALFQALRDYQSLNPRARDAKRSRIATRIRTILSSLPPALEARDLPTIRTIEEELAFFTGDDPYVPMSRLLLAKCRRQRFSLPDLPECQTKIDAGLDAFGWSHALVPFREAEIFQQIRELLARPKPTPLAIAYCHKVVRRGRGYRPNSILADGCAQHWSLIIGSRQKEGRCQFLLRDTDGGKPDQVATDWEIDRGDVWLDAETLMRSVYALEWLDHT
jgi:hypothetical protein